MADTHMEVAIGIGEEREPMWEDLFLLAFSFFLAISGLAVVVWGVATGRFFSMDGLWLALICLTLSAVFGGSIAWSMYTGELRAILRQRREKPEAGSEK
jgi:hypothetical protein